jgi:anti-anti-sigma factor
MTIRIEQLGDVSVVVAEGMFKGGTETTELDDVLRTLMVEEKRPKILLDVTGTDFLGSSAIGVIGAAHGHARDHKLNLWICGMRRRVQAVFDLMQFGPELRVFESNREAIEALRGIELDEQ